MEKRQLGKTGLSVTALGFGAMEIRGPRIWGGRPVTEEQAKRILNAVLDAGINFIDTSYDYGRSEEFIGKFISHAAANTTSPPSAAARRRTSRRPRRDPARVDAREPAAQHRDSLRRMKTDYVDIWQLHNPAVEQVRER